MQVKEAPVSTRAVTVTFSSVIATLFGTVDGRRGVMGDTWRGGIEGGEEETVEGVSSSGGVCDGDVICLVFGRGLRR